MLVRIVLLTAACAVSLSSVSVPTFAHEPFRLFGCAIGPTETDWMMLDAILHDDDSVSDLQFTIERTGQPTRKIPAQPVSAKGHFFYSTSIGPEGFLNSVRFADGNDSYVLDMLIVPPDPADESDMGGQYDGLTITSADGTITRLPCGESYAYVGYMADAMDCDLTNPYGAAGCSYGVPPQRQANDQALARALAN